MHALVMVKKLNAFCLLFLDHPTEKLEFCEHSPHSGLLTESLHKAEASFKRIPGFCFFFIQWSWKLLKKSYQSYWAKQIIWYYLNRGNIFIKRKSVLFTAIVFLEKPHILRFVIGTYDWECHRRGSSPFPPWNAPINERQWGPVRRSLDLLRRTVSTMTLTGSIILN